MHRSSVPLASNVHYLKQQLHGICKYTVSGITHSLLGGTAAIASCWQPMDSTAHISCSQRHAQHSRALTRLKQLLPNLRHDLAASAAASRAAAVFLAAAGTPDVYAVQQRHQSCGSNVKS
jgi:hypothetical protein